MDLMVAGEREFDRHYLYNATISLLTILGSSVRDRSLAHSNYLGVEEDLDGDMTVHRREQLSLLLTTRHKQLNSSVHTQQLFDINYSYDLFYYGRGRGQRLHVSNNTGPFKKGITLSAKDCAVS